MRNSKLTMITRVNLLNRNIWIEMYKAYTIFEQPTQYMIHIDDMQNKSTGMYLHYLLGSQLIMQYT